MWLGLGTSRALPWKPSFSFSHASPLSRLGSRLRRVAGLGVVGRWFFGLHRFLWLSGWSSKGLVATVLVSSGVGREAEVGVQGS